MFGRVCILAAEVPVDSMCAKAEGLPVSVSMVRTSGAKKKLVNESLIYLVGSFLLLPPLQLHPGLALSR